MTKKFLAVFSLAMSAAMLASCSGISKKVKFSENWYKDVTSSIVAGVSEKLVYSVSCKHNEEITETQYRSMRYGKGSYETELKTETLDGEIVYHYTTKLEMPISYKCYTDGKSEDFTDVVTSEVWFKSATSALEPIKSVKSVVSHSPTMDGEFTSLDVCYNYYNYTVETTYTDGKSGKCVVTDLTATENNVKEVSFSEYNDDYTTVDNEQLLLAVRAMESLSACTLNVFNSSWGTSLPVSVSIGTADSQAFDLTIDGTAYEQKSIRYVPVTIKLDTTNPGSQQDIWVAEKANSTNNANRNVILKIETEIFYSVGTMTYELISADFID